MGEGAVTRRLAVVKAPRSDLAAEIEDYLQACRSRGVRPATIRDSYGYSLRGVLLPWCRREGVSTAAEIDTRTLERFAAELRSRTTSEGKLLSPATTFTYIRAANGFLAWFAAEHDGTAPKIKLRQPAGRKVDTLERDQIRTLERAAISVRDAVMIRVLADTGIRPGELTSVTGADVRRVGRRHYLRVRGKTGERDAPVSPELYSRLRALARSADDPIFVSLRRDRRTGEHEQLTTNGVRQMLHDLAVNAGLRTSVTPYTFRHSACRWLLLSGQSTIMVERILGHGSEAMIRKHYANIGVDDAHDRLMTLLRSER
jgi:integrase/recombinase XerD